ncbi:MAG: hypothetical protein M3R52_13465 [Acidobacteriota bacterium]|nr:hypothetical protein [Acidobacteriota bacterium]
MQARPIYETELTRCEILWRARWGQVLLGGRHFDYDQRFYRIEEHKGLSFVLGLAVNKRHIVVGNFADPTSVNATGNRFYIDQLAFMAAQ